MSVEISIDGEKRVLAIPDDASFAKAIESARNYAASKHKVIVAIAINGEQLNAQKQLELTSKPLDKSVDIQIKTESPFKLSIAIVGELKLHLDNLEKFHIEAAKQINAGKNKEALFILDKCLIGWRAFFISITGISLITKIDYSSIDIKGESIVKKIASLNDALLKFADTFAKGDMVKLGDIAEYELKTLIYDWYDALDEIVKVVKNLQDVSSNR